MTVCDCDLVGGVSGKQIKMMDGDFGFFFFFIVNIIQALRYTAIIIAARTHARRSWVLGHPGIWAAYSKINKQIANPWEDATYLIFQGHLLSVTTLAKHLGAVSTEAS